MVNSLTPFFSPTSGDLSWDRQWRGRAAGWLGVSMSGPHEANFICTLKKEDFIIDYSSPNFDLVKSFLLNKIPLKCHC